MGRKVPQSVKFKKDYMMVLAFLLFFMIVAAECFLIVWLPWHLRLENIWAKQVAQQELIERYDQVRNQAKSGAGKLAKPAGSEAALIYRSLDRAAGYMHKYGKSMSAGQCRAFMDTVSKLGFQFDLIRKKKAFSQVIELDNTNYLKTLRGSISPAQAKK